MFRATLAGRSLAVKLLSQPDEQRLRALQRLEPSCAACATLPLHLLYRQLPAGQETLAGYAMRLIDPATSVSAVRLFNFEEIGRLRRYSWQDAVLAALRLAEAVAQLHRHGVVIGDLNPENVLFEQGQRPDAEPIERAVLLDSDSFQIEAAGGRRYPCPVNRAPYTAPELIGHDLSRTWRQPASDNFALAVLIYQLLLHDHPYDNAIHQEEPDLAVTARIQRGLYPHAAVTPPGLQPSPFRPAPQEVSAELDQALRRSFSAFPGLRPTAAEWVLLLRQLHRQVVPCQRQPRHHHLRGRSCPWCAVERRIGERICSFRVPPRPSAAVSGSHGQSAPTSENIGTGMTGSDTTGIDQAIAGQPRPEEVDVLRQRLEEQSDRAQMLIRRRAALAELLLQLEPLLLELEQNHGHPQSWIDLDALRQRLRSWRHRLSRWLGPRGRAQEREELVEQLAALSQANAEQSRQGVQTLQQQRLDLQQQLASVELTAIAELLAQQQDPAQTAVLLLRRLREQRQEQWLLEQLASQTLRSWRMDGFGETRLALLERHGLVRADQLYRNIERVTALPGIGRGLENSLRRHLNAALRQLQRNQSPAVTPLPPSELQALVPQPAGQQSVDEQLRRLEDTWRRLQEDTHQLREVLVERQRQGEQLLRAFSALS